MQRWEYKRLFMYASSDGSYHIRGTERTITGEQILELINQLGDLGWELVSVAQKIGNEIFFDPKTEKKAERSTSEALGNLFSGLVAGPAVTPSTQYKSATIGYWFWFKRPKE
jgi:hypothetical protein